MACVPKLRFKGFEDEWDNATLGDLGTVLMCRRIFEHQTSSTGEVPFYKIGTFGRTSDAFISRKLFSEYKEKYPYPKKGDILISAAGTIGRIVEYKGEDAYYQDSNIVWLNVTSDRLLNKYLYYYYQTIVWSKLEGGTVKRLYNKDLLDTKIHLPSIEEQQKIASFFSLLDQKIEKQQEKIEQLELFKKGMLQKIFSQEIRFKDENGRDFAEWVEVKLGDVAQIVGGGTPATNEPRYWNGDIPWFTPTEISHTMYVHKSIRMITQEGLKNSSAKLLPKNSILLTTRATLGEMAIATVPVTTNQGFQSIVPGDKVLSEFIYYLQPQIRRYCYKHASGSTFLEINKSSIEKFAFLLPTINEQRKIVSLLLNIDKKIEHEKKKKDELELLKRGLLQQMFV